LHKTQHVVQIYQRDGGTGEHITDKLQIASTVTSNTHLA